jgi:hypothetical protein
MTVHFCKRLSAWLGILATCLIVFVPVVSQLLLAAHADKPTAIVCSATLPLSGAVHHRHGDGIAACDYCDLLVDQPAVPTLPVLPPVLVMLVVLLAVLVLCTRFTPIGAFPSGQPRAPPASL